jgi:hypothetical protein
MALSKEQSEALCSLTPYYSKWVNDPFLALRSGMVNCLGFSLIASALDSGSKIIGITEESKWNDQTILTCTSLRYLEFQEKEGFKHSKWPVMALELIDTAYRH